MTKYKVLKIDTSKVNTPEEYWKAVESAKAYHIEGFKAVQAFCGGSLHKHRGGYAGSCGNIEFVVTKI